MRFSLLPPQLPVSRKANSLKFLLSKLKLSCQGTLLILSFLIVRPAQEAGLLPSGILHRYPLPLGSVVDTL